MAVVAEAENGDAAVRLFSRCRPDVTLMDISMPVLDGVAATAAICRQFPGSRIIVFTTFDGDSEVDRAITAGASACLLKGTFRDELLDTIRAVHSGRCSTMPRAAIVLPRPLERAHAEVAAPEWKQRIVRLVRKFSDFTSRTGL